MKKALCGLLALCLCAGPAGPALAAGSEPAFPRTVVYAGFSDLREHWCEPYARICVEAGLMRGVGTGFAPSATLTQGEGAVLAARIHRALNGVPEPAATDPWYQGAVDYLAALGLPVEAPAAYTSRETFFGLLAAVLPESELIPINQIKTLPDTQDPAVLRLYNAGILTGTDGYGTFGGGAPLSRAECAATAARIADPSLRKRFTPAGQVPAGPFAEDAVVMTVDGAAVGFGEFRDMLLDIVQESLELYEAYGLPFEWSGNFGMSDWPTYFKQAAKHALAAHQLTEAQARRLGCSQEALAQALFGEPSEAELAAFAREHEIDRAQPGADEMIAELILEGKLSDQVTLWVENAVVETTQIYEELDPESLWAAHQAPLF